jgi:pimeloyl-ACP methyl ester carboxylesterase
MALINVSGGQVYYAARGESGAPLLFLHGAGDSHLLWNGQLAAFAGTHCTYALDLPGHGRSTGQARDTISAYAAIVHKFLDALGIDKTIVAGSSMGGAVAQTLALESPELVSGLVLVGTGARLRVASAFIDGVKTDFQSTARALVEHYYAPGAPETLRNKSLAQLVKSGAAVLAQDFAACDRFDIRDRLPEILMPTLVVCGAEDKMTPPKYSEYLARHIPHSQLVLVPGAGHMVMLEQPQAFNHALSAWLETL